MRFTLVLVIIIVFIFLTPIGVIDFLTGHRLRLFQYLTLSALRSLHDRIFLWVRARPWLFKVYDYGTLVLAFPFFILSYIGKIIYMVTSRLDLSRPLPSGLPGHVGVDEEGEPRDPPVTSSGSGN